MPGKLDGRVGIITGGASGIGRATALVMAREGAKVVVSDVDDDGGEETVSLIKQSRGEARYIRTDVADRDSVEALVDGAVEAYGQLDWAFNNAGIGGAVASTVDYPDDAWRMVLDINLTGVWYCMRAELRHMVKQGGGVIVNTASDAGLIALPNIPAYVAAKHGVVGLTKGAALEYARSKIRINAVCPGYVETPILDPIAKIAPEFLDRARQDEPVGRLGQPQEIGEAVAWLCSDGASFVTGVAMPVDGGLLAH